MLEWRPFDYHSLEDLKEDIRKAEVELPVSENFDGFKKPLEIYGHFLKNRLSIQPLEGFDAGKDGTPSELTFRRYQRFAAGGAGPVSYTHLHGNKIERQDMPSSFLPNDENDGVLCEKARETLLPIPEYQRMK